MTNPIQLWGMVYEGELLPITRRTERDIWKYIMDLKRMTKTHLKQKTYRAVKINLTIAENE